jgi:hypothetical protein
MQHSNGILKGRPAKSRYCEDDLWFSVSGNRAGEPFSRKLELAMEIDVERISACVEIWQINFLNAFVDMLNKLDGEFDGNLMKPWQERMESFPQLVQRRGFYLDIMKYAETRPVSLQSAQAQHLLEAYDRLKTPLGHVSYTEMARALGVTALEVMQHVKHMHIHSIEWDVRFLNNHHNENVLFKLLRRNRSA